MVLNIRNAEADSLARRLAEMEGREITQAVIIALKEAIERRKETPSVAAARILAKHGIRLGPQSSKPVDPAVYHDWDHDIGDDR